MPQFTVVNKCSIHHKSNRKNDYLLQQLFNKSILEQMLNKYHGTFSSNVNLYYVPSQCRCH